MDFQDAYANFEVSNVTITTTTETAAQTTASIRPNKRTSKVLLLAWLQVTTGTDTTTLTPKWRRGTGTSGTQINESAAVPIAGAVGANEQLFCIGVDTLTDVTGQEYTVTVTQAGATGNGTILSSAVLAIAT